MIVPFIYELRSRGLKVGAKEAIDLAQALGKGLHESSLDGFYYVARSLLVHSELDLDTFDQAFLSHFKGIEIEAKQIKDELFDWLREAKERMHELSEEELAMLEKYDLDELERMFEERLREQNERHDGGNRWIGTGGSSPFGHSGAARQGIRVGGQGGNRSAVKVAGQRLFRDYRSDLTLDIRQMQLALRKLRDFTREGAEEELDLEGTIDATANNAGDLEVVTRPERRPNTRVILMMDVGGSMDPFAHLCSRLFTAAKKTTHWKELRTYYFHNCVYERVFTNAKFDEWISVQDLLHDLNGQKYKLIMLGDALMAPYELLSPNGSIYWGSDERVEGIVWLMRLREHFKQSIWLNPEPPNYWERNTIEYIKQVFPMFPLTVKGIGEAMDALNRKKR